MEAKSGHTVHSGESHPNQRIVKNTLVLFLSQILTKLINFGLVLILTRMLTSAEFGTFSFALAFVALFMIFANLGLNSLLTRDIARNKARINEFLGTSIPLVTLLSGLVLLFLNGLVGFFHWEASVIRAIRIFSIYLVFDNFSRHFISVFRAFEKMEFETLVNLFERLAMLLVSLLLWKLRAHLTTLLWSFTAIEFLKALVAFLFMRRFFQRIHWRWFNAATWGILKLSYPFALMYLFATISGRIDTVMLKIFHGESMVAYYSVARKLVESLTFIPENLVMALFPALSALFISEMERFRRTFRQSFLFLLWISLPIGVALALLARPIIQWLFTPEYLVNVPVLRWLSIALIFIFLKMHLMIVLNATGKQHRFAVIAAISMLVNVVLNYLLIPPYDLIGAGIATLISEIVAVILSVWELRSLQVPFPSLSELGKIGISTGGMALGILLITRSPGLVVKVVLGAAVYLGLSFAFRLLRWEHLVMLLEMVKRRFRPEPGGE